MPRFSLERTAEIQPFEFDGEQVAKVTEAYGSEGKERRFDLALYKSGTQWILAIHFASSWKNEAESHECFILNSPDAVNMLLLQYDAGKHIELPEGDQFAKKRVYLQGIARRWFSKVAGALMQAVPNAALKLPESGWRCDACSEMFYSDTEGVLVWFEKPQGACGSGLKLVHSEDAHPGCLPEVPQELEAEDVGLAKHSLKEYLGADGLMNLLGLIECDLLPKNEVTTMIKRLHVPLYEQARPFLNQAPETDTFEMAPGCYSQQSLSRLIEKLGK